MSSLVFFVALAIAVASAAEYELPKPPQCGDMIGHLADDSEVSLTEFPWAAFVTYGSTTKGFISCTGVMISRSHVLTFAECLRSYKFFLFFNPAMYLGLYEWESHRLCVVDQCRNNNKVHYQNWSESGPLVVLRIPNDVAVDNTTRPICLPSAIESFTHPVANDQLYMTGWAKEHLTQQGDTKKTKRVMTVLDTQDCERRVGEIAKDHFCVEGDSSGCYGFLGAPLMKKVGDSWVLVGLFTDEGACRSRSSIFVVPRISAKEEWIESILDVY